VFTLNGLVRLPLQGNSRCAKHNHLSFEMLLENIVHVFVEQTRNGVFGRPYFAPRNSRGTTQTKVALRPDMQGYIETKKVNTREK
jgi:hypothetical protein